MRTDLWQLADEIEADPGEVLVNKGQPPGHAFVIRSGSAEVIGHFGRDVLGPGSEFDATAPEVVVTACTPMRLLVLDMPRARAMLRRGDDEPETETA